MRRDERYTDAVRIWHALRADHRPLVTTSLVLAESHALIVRSGGYDRGMAFLDSVLLPSGPRVAWVDEEVVSAALDHWVRPYGDKSWSLTDAVSFEVMQRERIREAFAFDEHFVRAGFTLL